MTHSKFLSPQDIEKLSETDEGKKIVFNYIVSGRIALSVQQIFDKLDIVPTSNVQFDICNIIHDNLFKTKQEEIFAYIDSIKDYIEKNSFEDGQFFLDDEIGQC